MAAGARSGYPSGVVRLAWSRLTPTLTQLLVHAVCCVLGAALLVGYCPTARAFHPSVRPEAHAHAAVPDHADETVVPDQVEAEAEEAESGSAPEQLPAPTRRVRHDYVVEGAHHQLMPAQGPPPSTDERPTRVLHGRSQPARGPPARS